MGVAVDDKFTLGTNDLGGVFLAMGHHARTEIISDLAAPELDNTDGIIAVPEFLQSRMHSPDSRCRNRFHGCVIAKEPESEVNIVD